MVTEAMLDDGRDHHPGDHNDFVKEGCPTSILPLIFISEQEIASVVFDIMYQIY